MRQNRVIIFVASMLAGFWIPSPGADTVPLSELDLSKMKQGYGRPQIDRSIREKPLSIGGKSFAHGVGTHAVSVLWVDLAGEAERFQAWVGLDDAAAGPGSVNFRIFGDAKKLWESGLMQPGMAAKRVDLSVKEIRTLLLKVDAGGDGVNFDHADWAEAQFLTAGARPRAIDAPREDPVILTPKPAPFPRLNNPTVYGCRPGNPFLYRIPATGERPIEFAADHLPEGITLDKESGILRGTAPPRGEYKVTLRAVNGRGRASKEFRIVSGDKLALTPYMGWNHWYTHYSRISDAVMRKAADAMISSGMADAGYDYVCIDDCWMRSPGTTDTLRGGPVRDEQGMILPNARFPDMKALTDFIHAKGLKAGIYSSPGPTTCAGFTGCYGHEARDAQQFADWGFDLLKYDWCSYGSIAPHPSREELQKPYLLMGDLLRQQRRDIVYNLCQYGMGDVWEWGAHVGAQSWRTAGDLGVELDRLIDVARKNADHRAWNGPGHWNDPDYVQIGYIGDARVGGRPQPCPLTPSEQYAFMSLWCLMAAPLVYSGDMSRLDEFTLNVLCNPEVIEIDQDPLGQCAALTPLPDDAFLMVKDLEDGSKAVGLCNGGEWETTVGAPWSVIGVQGKQLVRDLWRQKDLGVFEDQFTSAVPRHGVVLVRIFEAR